MHNFVPKPAKHFYQLSGIFLISFIFWSFLVITKTGFITAFDNSIIGFLTNDNELNLTIAKGLTFLGNTRTLTIATVIVFILLLIAKKYWLALWFGGAMALTNMTNSIIKHFVERPRPSTKHLVYAGGFSYPSGHSLGSMTFFMLVLLLVIVLAKNKLGNRLLFFIRVVLFVLPILIGYSRIFVHVHFPSDVLGGFLLAGMALSLSYGILIQNSKVILPNYPFGG